MHALFFLLFALSATLIPVDSLNKYVTSYEPLNYPVVQKFKRLPTATAPIRIRFEAYNRSFSLLLRRVAMHATSFHPDAVVETDDRPSVRVDQMDLSTYEGKIEGDPSSHVRGSLFDGIFDGTIETGDRLGFTVERTVRYLPANEAAGFHSFIYRDEGIDHPMLKQRQKRTPSSDDDWHTRAPLGHCGVTPDVEHTMAETMASAEQPAPPVDDDHSYTMRDAVTGRQRRALAWQGPDGYATERHCALLLQVDHTLYREIYNNEGNKDDKATRNFLTQMLDNHVNRVNQIYGATTFGNNIRNIQFYVKKIKIHTPEDCEKNKKANKYCDENMPVDKYLDANSELDHDQYCLAYVFGYRDFAGGTLGLAWTASTNNAIGGVCARNTNLKGKMKSVNTGIVTMLNFGRRQPSKITDLTLAHEIGHNFGSPHDESSNCAPGDSGGGNYIMYYSSTSGSDPNNAQFSPCSKALIGAVLDKILKLEPYDINSDLSKKKATNCFMKPPGPICGNGIREGTEQCDCGIDEAECISRGDNCCWPAGKFDNNGKLIGCTFKKADYCSPSDGVCCNPKSCYPFQDAENKTCGEATECRDEVKCKGTSPHCPIDAAKPRNEKGSCGDGSKVCKKGECDGNICEVLGLKQCSITEGNVQDKCFLGCGSATSCTSTKVMANFSADRTNFLQPGRIGHKGIILTPGSQCDNGKGVCDILRRCRELNPKGTLVNLFEKASNITRESAKNALVENWWIFLITGLIGLAVLALFIRCCSVHTPSHNPNRSEALSLKQAVRNPRVYTSSKARRAPKAPAGGRGGANKKQPNRPKSSGTSATSGTSTAKTTPKQRKKTKKRDITPSSDEE